MRQHQVGHGKAGQSGFRLRAAPSRTFVTDLATGTGRGARKRRDRSRVVVRLDLHQDMRQFVGCPVHIAVLRTTRIETRDGCAFNDGRVVAVGNDSAFRLQLMRVLDHAEQRLVLLFAVDGPVRIENLVPAMFAISLREHHQLDIGWITLCLCKGVDEIIDFIV